MTRSTRGVELTAAAAFFSTTRGSRWRRSRLRPPPPRRAAHPAQRALALGFLNGCEREWLPAVMHVLREELPKIKVTISSKHSPQLAEGLATGKLDAAFMRPEEGHPDLVYQATKC